VAPMSKRQVPPPTVVSSLELKVPPVVVVLCCALSMWLTSKLLPTMELPLTNGLRVGVATAMAISGLCIAAAGVVSFRKAKTTVNPTKPAATSSLVSEGIYRYTRNPMYLAMALVLLAWAILLSDMSAFLFVPLFVVYINRFQIDPEERALLALFGSEYTTYREKVRRWL